MTDLSLITFKGLMLDPDFGQAIVRSLMPAHITWLMGKNRDLRAFYAVFRRGAVYRELVMALSPATRLLVAYYPRLRLFPHDTTMYRVIRDLPGFDEAGFPAPITAQTHSFAVTFPMLVRGSQSIELTQRELEPIRVVLINFVFPEADVDVLYGLGAELPPYTGEGTDPQVQGRTEYARMSRGRFTTNWTVLRLNGRQYVGEQSRQGSFTVRFDFRSTPRGADHAMILIRDVIWLSCPLVRERGIAPLGLEA
jgi:hypothetical protein